jgi:hypothetical protein
MSESENNAYQERATKILAAMSDIPVAERLNRLIRAVAAKRRCTTALVERGIDENYQDEACEILAYELAKGVK